MLETLLTYKEDGKQKQQIEMGGQQTEREELSAHRGRLRHMEYTRTRGMQKRHTNATYENGHDRQERAKTARSQVKLKREDTPSGSTDNTNGQRRGKRTEGSLTFLNASSALGALFLSGCSSSANCTPHSQTSNATLP